MVSLFWLSLRSYTGSLVKGVERSGITIIEQVATYVSYLARVHRK